MAKNEMIHSLRNLADYLEYALNPNEGDELWAWCRRLDDRSMADPPVVDESDWSVRWRGRRCRLKYTNKFRLIRLLIQRKNSNVPNAEIGEALRGDDLMTADAIRQTVLRLKSDLVRDGLNDLADAIESECEHVRLDLRKYPASPPAHGIHPQADDDQGVF